MYSYITAFVQTSVYDGQYRQTDIQHLQLNQIFFRYPRGYVLLNNDVFSREETLNLYDLPEIWRTSEYTLNQFLVQNGNLVLPTTTNPLTFTWHRAQYYNVHYATFKQTPVNRAFHIDYELSYDQQIDVLLTKPSVDYFAIQQNCLFTAGGLLHFTEGAVHGLTVYDAARTLRKKNDNQMGIIDFQRVSTLSCVNLTRHDVYKQKDTQPLSDVLYVSLPEPINGRKVLLSIGGFLVVPDQHNFLVGDQTYKIDFKRFNWLERFFILQRLTDMDWEIEHLGEYASKEQVFADETIRKLFDLSQTFVIYLDLEEELFITRHPVEQSKLPGLYYSYEKIGLPLLGSEGRLIDYKHSKFAGVWSLQTNDYMDRTNIFHSTDWVETPEVVGEFPDPNKPAKYAGAHFLVFSKSSTET